MLKTRYQKTASCNHVMPKGSHVFMWNYDELRDAQNKQNFPSMKTQVRDLYPFFFF